MRRHLTTLIATVAALSLTALPAAAESTTSTVAPTGAPASESSSANPAASRKVVKARYGTFKSTKYSGKGDKLIKLPKKARYGLVTIKVRGEGKFQARLLDSKKKSLGVLVNGWREAPYHGTTAFGLERNTYSPRYLKIRSTSAKKWTVKVAPLHRAKALKKTQKGSGDAVFRVTLKKSKNWKIKYRSDAKSNVIVTAFGRTRNQTLWNEIRKKYTGKKKVNDFSGFVVVRSYGDWTIKR